MGEFRKSKGWLISALAVFVVTMGYDYYIHHVCMKDIYAATAKLWRNPAEMAAMFPWVIAYHAILAVLVAMFYHAWRENQTMGKITTASCPYRKSMLGFGVWIGLFTGVIAAASYIWIPIPAELAKYWFAAELLKGILVSIALTFVYNRYEAK